jgi:hypothetical protein
MRETNELKECRYSFILGRGGEAVNAYLHLDFLQHKVMHFKERRGGGGLAN